MVLIFYLNHTKSTPIVEIKASVKVSSQNLINNEDLPTDESPTIIILNR